MRSTSSRLMSSAAKPIGSLGLTGGTPERDSWISSSGGKDGPSMRSNREEGRVGSSPWNLAIGGRSAASTSSLSTISISSTRCISGACTPDVADFREENMVRSG